MRTTSSLGASHDARRARSLDAIVAMLLIAGIAGLFLFDISAPRGQVDGVGYAALVALCIRYGPRIILVCAILTTLLTIVAHFFLPDAGISVAGELENRFFAIASIWVVAYILISRVGLERALVEREANAKRYQEALLRIVREVVSSDEPLEHQLRALNEIAGTALGVERTAVFMINADRTAYRCLDLWLRSERKHILVPDMVMAESPGYFEAIRTGIVVAADDALTDPLVRHRYDLLRKYNIGAVIAAGIFVQTRMQGLISLSHAGAPRHWTTEEIAFARSLSSVVSLLFLARERANLESKLLQAAKMQALGQLAGGIAHDFSNLLSAVAGFAGLLKQDLAAGTPQQSFAQRILDASDRGKELVEQILAFARVEGRERRPVGLKSVLKDSEALLAGSLPKTTKLLFDLPPDDILILGRDIQISQLVINLCHNASDSFAGEAGTITVTLGHAAPGEIERLDGSAPPGELLLGVLDPARKYALIRVSDTGPGIAPDILPRIFEPFFTTKGRRRGSGLGLAVVHGVVEGHGGACHVKSSADTGTEFSVYLPLASENGMPLLTPESKSLPDAITGKERLLIVDDEADITDMLTMGFDRLGYEAVAVNDPIEALAAFEEDPQAWDAVIADQLMPEMRGLDLVRKLKALRPGIVAIVCTGYSDGGSEEMAREAGVDAFFRKPVDAQGIAPRLRAALDARKAR